MSDNSSGGSFHFLEIQMHENNEGWLTTRESRLNLIQKAEVVKDLPRFILNYSWDCVVRDKEKKRVYIQTHI